MKIDLHRIPVRELTNGFIDNSEQGVVAFGGSLDIRPPYQREFIYNDKQRNAVIDTVRKDFPLNVMYWAVRPDGRFEVIDGQQRTLSICQYVNGDYSIDGLAFHNLQDDQQEQILNYELMVYFCSGTDSEKLEWFKTIIISGVALTDQELLNAVYAGPWTTDAKRIFSKSNCAAYSLASDLVKGSPIRQDFLETAIWWHSEDDTDDRIKLYMSKHQHDDNASAIWSYFQKVISWVNATFPKYRKEMKGIDWGYLYRQYKDRDIDTNALERRVKALMMDDEVKKKAGIYYFVFDGDTRHLQLRTFTDSEKREVYERQEGVCKSCGETFDYEEMEGDHITPWSGGGKTSTANCQMLCRDCNRRKSSK